MATKYKLVITTAKGEVLSKDAKPSWDEWLGDLIDDIQDDLVLRFQARVEGGDWTSDDEGGATLKVPKDYKGKIEFRFVIDNEAGKWSISPNGPAGEITDNKDVTQGFKLPVTEKAVTYTATATNRKDGKQQSRSISVEGSSGAVTELIKAFAGRRERGTGARTLGVVKPGPGQSAPKGFLEYEVTDDVAKVTIDPGGKEFTDKKKSDIPLDLTVKATYTLTAHTKDDSITATATVSVEDDDLSTPEGRDKLLQDWTQEDDLDSTTSDQSRCQSNSAIASVLKKDGPEGLARVLSAAAAKTRGMLATEKDAARRKRLQAAAADLDAAAATLRSGHATRADLDRASDALFRAYNSENQDFDDTGKVKPGVEGMGDEDIRQMEKDLGLDPEAEVPVPGITQRGVMLGAFDKVPNGGTARVAVHNPPDDSGGERLINHAVLFGKDKDGKRFIYDSLGKPPYLRESELGTDEFEKRAEKYIGKEKNDAGESKIVTFVTKHK